MILLLFKKFIRFLGVISSYLCFCYSREVAKSGRNMASPLHTCAAAMRQRAYHNPFLSGCQEGFTIFRIFFQIVTFTTTRYSVAAFSWKAGKHP